MHTNTWGAHIDLHEVLRARTDMTTQLFSEWTTHALVASCVLCGRRQGPCVKTDQVNSCAHNCRARPPALA
eukprot:3312584-Alexandrium_andersonii.AAC.1